MALIKKDEEVFEDEIHNEKALLVLCLGRKRLSALALSVVQPI